MKTPKHSLRKIVSFLNNEEEDGGYWLPGGPLKRQRSGILAPSAEHAARIMASEFRGLDKFSWPEDPEFPCDEEWQTDGYSQDCPTTSVVAPRESARSRSARDGE